MRSWSKLSLVLLLACVSAFCGRGAAKGAWREYRGARFPRSTPERCGARAVAADGVETLLPRGMPGKVPVTIFLRNVSARAAIEVLCKSHDLWFKEDDSGIIRIMTTQEFSARPGQFPRRKNGSLYAALSQCRHRGAGDSRSVRRPRPAFARAAGRLGRANQSSFALRPFSTWSISAARGWACSPLEAQPPPGLAEAPRATRVVISAGRAPTRFLSQDQYESNLNRRQIM